MALAADRATTDLAVYAPEQIGRTRYRTPEGFLVCEGARIARVGPMLYTQAEMPDIEAGPYTSMITVERGEDVLFHPDCIASYVGKPVTNDHPPEPVTPDNFKKYAVGVVLNPRRGEGADANHLLADLLITEADAIEAIDPPGNKPPKVELSAGYDTDVEQIKPGLGRQTRNVGNHVALVERGRAGPSCKIQDEEPDMATKTRRRILDGIRKAFKAKDEAALEEQLEKAEGLMDDEEEAGEAAPQTLVIRVEGAAAPAAAEEAVADEEEAPADPYEARFKGIEDCLSGMKDTLEKLAAGPTADEEPTEEKPEGETEEVADEDADEDKDAEKPQVQDTMSKAEILAPGIKLPTKDGATGGLKRSALTDLRRRALKTAVADSARKVHVDAVMGGRVADFDKMRPSQVAIVFDAAAAVARASNNSTVRPTVGQPGGTRMTAAMLQERINERRKRS